VRLLGLKEIAARVGWRSSSTSRLRSHLDELARQRGQALAWEHLGREWRLSTLDLEKLFPSLSDEGEGLRRELRMVRGRLARLENTVWGKAHGNDEVDIAA